MANGERERLPERHRRASAWFERHGDRDEAIRHALAAPDFELAADLIEHAIPELRRARRDAVLQAAIEALPDALVQSRPALSIHLVGPLLQSGVTAGIAERLTDAETRLRELGDHALRDHIGAIELFRSGLAQLRGDMEGASVHAQRVFELSAPEAHLERAGAAGFLAIVAWSQGDLDTAEPRWAECTDGLLHIGYISDALGTMYARGQIAIARGRLGEAQRVLERGLALAAERTGQRLLGSADLHIGLAGVSLERNDLVAARQHLAHSEAADLTGMQQLPSRKLVVEAGLAAADGKWDEVLALLDEAARLHVGDFFPVANPIAAMRARVSIRRRDWPAVEKWQRESGISADSALSYAREYEHITLARALLAKGESAEAMALLNRLLDAAARNGRNAVMIEIEVLRAVCLDTVGDAVDAQAAVRHALELAAPEGQARVFLEEGEPVTALLRTAVKGKGASPYARQLLATFGSPQPVRPVAHPDLLDPLSDRELDVLRLLRGDLSGPDIANALHVSLNTVRTHTKNIYEKLGVNSRRAAVRRAEEMTLLRRDRPA
jgi:LuxR family maltose regulon positive regulatory protein